MARSSRGIRLAAGILAIGWGSAAWAQDNLDRGKSGAQLYASDCAICHKSVQGLSRAGGLFGLESFLRQHYTASRESAAVIAGYLKDVDRGPPPAAARGRTPKRTAKGGERGKPGAAKPAQVKAAEPKPSESKPAEKSSDAKPSEPKPSEPKPVEAKPAEPKANERAKPE